jgi:fucose 4-O-acetylase-like acetyltransferase
MSDGVPWCDAKHALENPDNCTRFEVASGLGLYMQGGALADIPWMVPAPLSLMFTVAIIGAMAYFVWYSKTRKEPGGGSGSGGRVYYVDNCRFCLETLVISKHMVSWFFAGRLQNNYDCWYWTALTNWTESFHMAMFACCSGLLSKGYLTPARSKRTIMRVIVPFILLNWLVYPISHYIILGKPPPSQWHIIPSPFVHEGILWFLYAWLFWRITTGVFLSTMPPHTVLVVSYLISWMAGYWFEGVGYLNVDTTFAWLPMYCTGYVIPLRSLEVLDRKWVRMCGVVVTVLILSLHLLFAYLSDPNVGALRGQEGPDSVDHDQPFDYGLYFQPWMSASNRHFYFSHPTQVKNSEPSLFWIAWTQRVVFQFLVTWPTGVALMVLVPHSQKFFTEWGSRTMYAYVGQVITKALIQRVFWICFGTDKPFGPTGDQMFGPLVTLVFAVAMGLLTNVSWACSYTHRWMKYIMEPEWIFAFFLDDEQLLELTAEKKGSRPPPPPPPAENGVEEDDDGDDTDDSGDSNEETLKPLWRRLF